MIFQNTNLVHNSFNLQQYICYTTLLNMFRAASPSVSSRTVRGWRADRVCSPPAYCTAAYRGWRYQRPWWYNWSSWWWAACCSKHVEECSVTYILLTIKRIVHQGGIFKSLCYDARSQKHQIIQFMILWHTLSLTLFDTTAVSLS